MRSLFFTLPVRVYSFQPLLIGCYPGISKQQLLPGHSTMLALQHTLGPSPQPWSTPTALISVLNVYLCVCVYLYMCLHAHARFLLEDMEGAYIKYIPVRQFDRRPLGLTFQANRSASYVLVWVSTLRFLQNIHRFLEYSLQWSCNFLSRAIGVWINLILMSP